MQKFIDQYMKEIQHLKNLNRQHQNQIESLLKFNQRLLTIIQEEINNNQSKHAQKSLQSISQVTQVDSQLMDQMMRSLKKTRKKLAARSQKGNPYFANIQTKYPSNINSNNRMDNKLFVQQTKDLEFPQRFPFMDKQFSNIGKQSSFSKKRQKNFMLNMLTDLYKRNKCHQIRIKIIIIIKGQLQQVIQMEYVYKRKIILSQTGKNLQKAFHNSINMNSKPYPTQKTSTTTSKRNSNSNNIPNNQTLKKTQLKILQNFITSIIKNRQINVKIQKTIINEQCFSNNKLINQKNSHKLCMIRNINLINYKIKQKCHPIQLRWLRRRC